MLDWLTDLQPRPQRDGSEPCDPDREQRPAANCQQPTWRRPTVLETRFDRAERHCTDEISVGDNPASAGRNRQPVKNPAPTVGSHAGTVDLAMSTIARVAHDIAATNRCSGIRSVVSDVDCLGSVMGCGGPTDHAARLDLRRRSVRPCRAASIGRVDIWRHVNRRKKQASVQISSRQAQDERRRSRPCCSSPQLHWWSGSPRPGIMASPSMSSTQRTMAARRSRGTRAASRDRSSFETVEP